ncbi:MAG: aminopeptidase [Tissierellia bacterium]|nr:aminopeptidase [Tissierellia bacterium]MDD4726328.1 aminopeptidase [Tissierellia bacterium]
MIDNLTKKFPSAWEQLRDGGKETVFNFCNEYKDFLDSGKTERESSDEIIKQAKDKGYISFEDVISKGSFKAGDKIYAENKGKGVALFVIGQDSLEKGMKIVGSHIDTPRLDLKAQPLYQDGELALLKTHYYGGIKKYQWVAIPLALHGVIFNKKGEKINIVIGEDENDPVFYITDLLPHLAKEQMDKKMGEGIIGESLNVLIGSIPYNGEKEKDDAIKLNVLKLLNEKYGIVEEDFTVAELEIVPAGKARDVGIDRSMVAAHGHDDRVCAFASLKAVLEIEEPKQTVVGLFVDKEEVGSLGNTGMESMFFENVVAELLNLEGVTSHLGIRRAMANSKVLSGDVTAGFDPNYPDVSDKRNTPYIGKGVTITKYTGSRGKSSSNDANAEFLSEIRDIFNEADVSWQVGELGKVDEGGGGTIAYILANKGAEVVDCGTPMLSMHAPIELISKIDLYNTYKAYKAFYQG